MNKNSMNKFISDLLLFCKNSNSGKVSSEIDDYFDFSKITIKEMKILLKDIDFTNFLVAQFGKSENNVKLRITFLENIHSNKALNQILAYKEIFDYLLECYKLVLYFNLFKYPRKMSKIFTIDVSNIKELYKFINENETPNIFYRGQSIFKWNLVPSLVRNLLNENCLIDLNTIFNLYNEKNLFSSLIDTYNLSFPYKKIQKPNDINYEFLSWMQHAASFSPLIDFTKEFLFASSFALQSQNSFEFNNEDSAIFLLEYHNSPQNNLSYINDAIKQIKIITMDKKIVPGTRVKIKKLKEHLDFTNLKSIKETLSLKYEVIDSPTNDRMKRQRGLFLFIYKCVFISGQLFPYTNPDTFIYKVKIDSEGKKFLKKILKNNQYANLTCLLNPYLSFKH